MEKKTFYRIVIFILIVCNLGSLGYIYFGRENHPLHPRHHGPRDLIIEKLGFTADQEKEYDIFIKKHQSTIRSLQLKRVKLKDELYSLLNENTIDTVKKERLLDLIQQNHDAVENIHFHHFEEIKSICKGKNQLKKYEQLSTDFSEFFTPPMRK